MGKAAGTVGAIWYVVAGVSYCAASIVEKGLLNWFVGPLWLVAVIWFGPLLVERVRGDRQDERDSDDAAVGQSE